MRQNYYYDDDDYSRSLGRVPERPIRANPGLKFCFVFVFYLSVYCLEQHFFCYHYCMFVGVEAQQCFVSSTCMFLDKKTLLQIGLNPGLTLTIF